MSKSPKDTKGPVVKSGPTRGENRSRTKEGTWRKKRRDTGKSRSKKDSGGGNGCFLTTAACEYQCLPDDCYELQTLRSFRDNILMPNLGGKALVHEYYQVAPGLVSLLDDASVADLVWEQIQKTVGFIENNRNEDAKKCYTNMVNPLKKHL